MRAAVGDRMVVVSASIDHPARDGEVLEVRGPQGAGPYLVRWSDTGHESLFWPGPDSHVDHNDHTDHTDGERDAVDSHAGPAGDHPRLKTWRVDIHVYEQGPSTTAHAVLHGDAPTALEGLGQARRRPGDPDVPEIGEEVAAARALRRLADHLMGVAADDIEGISGGPVKLRS